MIACKKVKKSLKKMPILKYTRMGWKKHGIHKKRPIWSERSKIIAEGAKAKAVQRGHDATYFEVVLPNQAKIPKDQRKKQLLHICKSCLSYSGLELWAKPCGKKQCRQIMPSKKFWKGMAKTNDIEIFMEELAIPNEKRMLIRKIVADE